MSKIKATKQELYDMYISKKMPSREIAKKYNCTASAIRYALKRYDIPVKGRNGKINATKFYVNKQYFNKWSINMAYLLGYIAADGCIRPKKYEFKIKSIDYELLDFLKNELESNFRIKKEKNSNCYGFCVYSGKFVQSLIDKGIHHRKAWDFDMPDIPEKYFWHFLRGYVDGDGSIKIPNYNSRIIGFNIVGHEKFLKKVLSILKTKIKCPNYSINYNCKSNVNGTLAINSSYAFKCLNKMYNNNYFALNRKKYLALQSIEYYKNNLSYDKICCICGGFMKKVHFNRKKCNACR